MLMVSEKLNKIKESMFKTSKISVNKSITEGIMKNCKAKRINSV